MKTRDEVVDVAKRWMAEIADLLEKYPLLVVMRDNAGENKSAELKDYFTSMGVENYFSTSYDSLRAVAGWFGLSCNQVYVDPCHWCYG